MGGGLIRECRGWGSVTTEKEFASKSKSGENTYR